MGSPQMSDFKIIDEEMPVLEHEEILLKTRYVSVDPYLRGRMGDVKSYAAPFELNQPMVSSLISEVVESKHPGFSQGEFVKGHLEWREYQKSDGSGLTKVDHAHAPLTAYLGVLGMTGLTAYLGLMEIGKPKSGETLVVSGAAGAVGSVVGQIGKILGCRVVGIAGTDEKTRLLIKDFGFDAAINYHTAPDMSRAVAQACPQGVDVYFDNVGGRVTDGVITHINKFARIVVCGSISVYNETTVPMGPRLETIILRNSALMQGFLIGNYVAKYGEAMTFLTRALEEGKLISKETIAEGFENIPQAFMDLFSGKNTGKMIVKV